MMIITKAGPISLLVLSLFALGGGKCADSSPGNSNPDTAIQEGDGAPRKIDEDKNKEAERLKKAQDEAKILEKAAADAVAEAAKAVQAEEKNPSDPNHKAVDAAINKAQTALDQLKKNDLIDSALKDNLQKKLQDAVNKHQQLNHSGTISFTVKGKGKKNLLLAGSDTPLNAKFSGKKPISCKWTSTFEAAKIANVVFADDKNCNTTVTATLNAADLSCMREFKIILNAGAPKPLEQSVSVTNKWCQFKANGNPNALPSDKTTKIVVRSETSGDDVLAGTKDKGFVNLNEAKEEWKSYSNAGNNVTQLVADPNGGIWFAIPRNIYLAPVTDLNTNYLLLNWNPQENISHLGFFQEDPNDTSKPIHGIALIYDVSSGATKASPHLFHTGDLTPRGYSRPYLTLPPVSPLNYYSEKGFTSSLQWGKNLLLGLDSATFCEETPASSGMGWVVTCTPPLSALYLYDGTNIEPYDNLENPWELLSLSEDSNRRVTALAANQQQTQLWMGFQPQPLPVDPTKYKGGSGGLAVAVVVDQNKSLRDVKLADSTETGWALFQKGTSGLLDNHIRAIVVDKEGDAWIATSEGLNRATATLTAGGTAAQKVEIKQWFHFNEDDASKTADDNYIPVKNIVDLAYRKSDNTLWIATENNGVLKLHIDLLEP